MSLISKIDSDLVSAMKRKDVETLKVLRVLKGEIQRNEQGKDGKIVLTDTQVTTIIKKMVDNLKETGGLGSEITILSEYLPKQLTNDELVDIVIGLIEVNKYNSIKDMGKIMKYFKDNYEHRYDGSMLSSIIKLELNKRQ